MAAKFDPTKGSQYRRTSALAAPKPSAATLPTQTERKTGDKSLFQPSQAFDPVLEHHQRASVPVSRLSLVDADYGTGSDEEDVPHSDHEDEGTIEGPAPQFGHPLEGVLGPNQGLHPQFGGRMRQMNFADEAVRLSQAVPNPNSGDVHTIFGHLEGCVRAQTQCHPIGLLQPLPGQEDAGDLAYFDSLRWGMVINPNQLAMLRGSTRNRVAEALMHEMRHGEQYTLAAVFELRQLANPADQDAAIFVAEKLEIPLHVVQDIQARIGQFPGDDVCQQFALEIPKTKQANRGVAGIEVFEALKATCEVQKSVNDEWIRYIQTRAGTITASKISRYFNQFESQFKALKESQDENIRNGLIDSIGESLQIMADCATYLRPIQFPFGEVFPTCWTALISYTLPNADPDEPPVFVEKTEAIRQSKRDDGISLVRKAADRVSELEDEITELEGNIQEARQVYMDDRLEFDARDIGAKFREALGG